MSIIIPSSKTYDKQNPKVCDNVIERVEIGRVDIEVEYETNKNVDSKKITGFYKPETGLLDQTSLKTAKYYRYRGNPQDPQGSGYELGWYIACSYCAYKNYFASAPTTIKIEKLQYNTYIEKINGGTSGDELNIKYSCFGLIKKGFIQQQFTAKINEDEQETVSLIGSPTETLISQDKGAFQIPIKLEKKVEYGHEDEEKLTLSNELNAIKLSGNLSTTKVNEIIIDGKEYYEIEIDGIVSAVKTITMGGSVFAPIDTGADYIQSKEVMGNIYGEYTEYEAEYIQLDFMGNTKVLAIKNNITYIPETNKTSKKVFSIEGNELMQMTDQIGSEVVRELKYGTEYIYELTRGNIYAEITFYGQELEGKKAKIWFWSEGNKSEKIITISVVTTMAIKLADGGYIDGIISIELLNYYIYQTLNTNHELILENYKKGKETATIRCSIGDYFDKYGVKRVNTNKFSRNLLPKEYLFGTTSTQHGVTATVLPDGGVRIQGKNTHNKRIFFNLTNQYFSDKAIVCYEGTTSATDGVYTISMFGEGLSNVALGYNEHNATTWLSILPDWKVDAIVYPMLNKGGFIPYEAHDSSMVFQIGDQVIPMVYGADGKDRPMSTYQDGTAKVFQVLGTKIFYDGAVWQELSLQEV